MTNEKDEYKPAVVTAGEDREVELALYDPRTEETEHVSMPDPDGGPWVVTPRQMRDD